MDNTPLSTFLARDHAEIDGLLNAVDPADPLKAVSAFAEFARRLEARIVWEEENLFPAAVRAAPQLARGTIAALRLEHVRLRELERSAAGALARGDSIRARASMGELSQLLGTHNLKDERVLYPACDELLGPGGAKALLSAIAASPVRS